MSDGFAQVLASYPRFAGAVGQASDLLPFDRAELAEILTAGGQLFPLDSRRAQAQLWFYSFLGSVWGPTACAIVEFETVPERMLDDAHLARHRDGYWMHFQPDSWVSADEETVIEAGRGFGTWCVDFIPALAAASDGREAPLWALAADALVQSALEAGNQAWDSHRGVEVARWLLAGFDEATERGNEMPGLRAFDELSGSFGDFDEAETDEESVVIADRHSCCLIYRSPGSSLCTSCPKRSAESREAALKGYAFSLRA